MISVICPTYNEAKYIDQILTFFTEARPSEKELIIIDCGSTDETKAIVSKWMQQHNNIKLLDNPNKFVPFALNMAIKASSGSPIIRLDAHTQYDKQYFEQILATFDQVEADIVGGPMRPIGESNFQDAVAICTSVSFGVGNSQFHNENHEGYVDSVYLGAWKREIFGEVGYFDEQLKRNQDDEFHYRAKSFGKKIYLNPAIKSYYFPRDQFSKLFKQYYQYGVYKPYVLKKVRSETKWRHLIPMLFCLYVFSLPMAYFWPIWLIPMGLYTLLSAFFSIRHHRTLKGKLYSMLIFPTLHLAYGLGFIRGLFLSKK